MLLIDIRGGVRSLRSANAATPFVYQRLGATGLRVRSFLDRLPHNIWLVQALTEELARAAGALPVYLSTPGDLLDVAATAIASGRVQLGVALPDAVTLRFEPTQPTVRDRRSAVVFPSEAVTTTFLRAVAKDPQALSAFQDALAAVPATITADLKEIPALDASNPTQTLLPLLSNQRLMLVPELPTDQLPMPGATVDWRFQLRWMDNQLAGAGAASGPVPPLALRKTAGTSPPSPPAQPVVGPCPADFVVKAPCRILRAGGGPVQMSALELPGFPAGTYEWTSGSANLQLTNANTKTVTVKGLATPSTARDAETITVTRTAQGCAPVTKTVNVTVAKVTFSQSANQTYGYDNFDTPADTLDDHISIKSGDHTFVQVTIEGGAIGTDFNFACDKPSVCTPAAPDATASFDLQLNAGATNKDSATLHARVKCPSNESFSHIQVHVYKERLVEVVVAKIFDSTVAGTNLNFPNADYAGHTAAVNAKAKEAVVKYDITNYVAANATKDVHYDLDGNGVLSFDIKAGGGAEVDAIKAAMTGTGTKIRVAIVRNMKSFYFLSAAAVVGDTTVTVTAGSPFFAAGRVVPLGTGDSQEDVTVASSAGSTLTLAAPLTKAHPAGAPLEFPAGGWSSDPILIIEGTTAEDIIKWSVAHEAGHRDRGLNLADIIDDADIMHFQQSWTDHRLRYCPRTKQYDQTKTENQWETIPRN